MGYWGVRHPQVHSVVQYSENSIIFGKFDLKAGFSIT